KNPQVAEAQKLLAAGFEKTKTTELIQLLAFPQQTVRLEAQFELMARPAAETEAPLIETALKGPTVLARLHAIWALAEFRAKSENFVEKLRPIIKDADPNIRGQSAKLFAKADSTPLGLMELVNDANPRVAFLTLQQYARVFVTGPQSAASAKPLYEKLKSNADGDVYIRHAVVDALARTLLTEATAQSVYGSLSAAEKTPAVRLGQALVLRRLQSAKLAEFLSDEDPRIVAEAARGIHDDNITAAWPALAALTEKPGLPEAVVFRALSANFKLGTEPAAVRLATFAARTSEADFLRTTALKLLMDWAKPPRRDAITGLIQTLPERPAAIAVNALKPVLGKIFTGSDGVRKEAVAVVSRLGIKEVGPLMVDLVADTKQLPGTRVEALFALEALKAKELPALAQKMLSSDVPAVRAAARVVQAKANEKAAALELPKILNDEATSLIEKQMILGVMGTMKESAAIDEALAAWLDKLNAGTVPAELKLDLLDAAQTRGATKNLKLHAPLREKWKTYDDAMRAKAAGNPTIRNSEALAGGDAAKGREIFINSAAVYCQRCHKVDGQGGEVGPVMNGLGTQKTREYLLESIVNPNAQIAQGYQSVILNLLDGKIVSGVLRSKDAKNYVVVTPENKVLTIPAEDVESSKPDKSAMPEDLYKKLTKREIRDLVEYLVSLKEPVK
ncbi:MAG: hypothetical protein ACRCZF_04185, partial [Gemmataceae bacterium]